MRLRACIISLVIGIFSSLHTYAQKIDYGMTFIYNKSSHTNYDPTIPEDGQFQWNFLGAFGFGAYASKYIGSRIAIQTNLLYQQKGYKEYAQFGIIGGSPTPITNLNFKNTFEYLSAELLGKYTILKGKTSDLLINAGVEYNYLLDYDLQSDVTPFNTYYPTSVYQDQWKSHTLSLITSISLDIDKSVAFEFGFNRSLTPVLETDNLVVKDWIWTLRTQISIPELFRKDDDNPSQLE